MRDDFFDKTWLPPKFSNPNGSQACNITSVYDKIHQATKLLIAVKICPALSALKLFLEVNMKKIAAVLSVLLCLSLFAGCSAKGAKEKTDWDYIAANKQLIVGLDDTFAPMGFRDTSGELVGFDIDLANAVGEKLGVEIKLQPIDWSAKELELEAKRIDCIWNGMSATPAREESMSLTKKYLNNRIVIMLKQDVSIESKADLANLKLGIQEGSSSLEVVEADADYETFKGAIQSYKTYDEVIMDIQAGRLDGMIVDEVLGEYKNNKLNDKLVVAEVNFGDDYYAIGCRKADKELTEKINSAIKELIDKGTAAEISTKWFGKDIVIFK